METKMIKRFGAGLLVSLHVVTMPAFAAVCGSSQGLGSVFSVMDGGEVNLTTGTECNFDFYSVSQINAEGNLSLPGAASSEVAKKCRVHTSDGVVSRKDVSGSGDYQSPLTIAAYRETTSALNFYADTTSLYYSNGGDATRWDQRTTVVWVNDKAELDVGGRKIQLERKVSAGEPVRYVLPEGEYGKISWGTVGSQFGGFVISGPIRAKEISGSNCNWIGNGVNRKPTGIEFYANGSGDEGEYYINTLRLGDGCGIFVPASARVTLNVLGKVSVSDSDSSAVGLVVPQSNPCWNFTVCREQSSPRSTWSELDSQKPENLYINLYYGNISASDRYSISARLYARNGDFTMLAGNGNALVGEVLAKNIISERNNDQSQFFSKTTAQATLQAAAYSLTPPVAEAVTETGDYVYRAMQSDYRADGRTPGTSGDLKAFVLNADSSQEQTAAWSAAEVVAGKMLEATRADKLRTEALNWATNSADFEALSTVFSGDTLAQACAVNPTRNECRLSSGDPRDPTSMVGTPWRVAPLIVGDSVLFATDDGILYSVDKSNGNLNWGWIPREVLALSQAGLTATPQSLMQGKHPWGQIALVQVLENVTAADGTVSQQTKSYLTGAALGGQLHFSIEVEPDGKSLKRVVWLDYRAGKYSPGSSVAGWSGVAGRPYGGQAPVQAVSGSNKVAYVVGGQLVTRTVNTADAATVVDFTSGGATVIGDTTPVTPPAPTSTLLYVDDSALYFGAADGKVYKSNSAGTLAISANSVDKVSTGNSGPVWYVNGARIASASGNGLMLLAQTERLVTAMKFFDDKWSYAWRTGFNADHTPYSDPSTNPKINALASDKAYLSAPATIKSGTVILFYTKAPDECSISAWTFGPLKLLDGTSALASSEFRFESMTSLDNQIGGGESTGGSNTRFNGKDGILAGSGGATSGGSGNPDTAFINPPTGGYKDRLNWRELTNFF